MASLPYVTAPGNIERALNAIRSAQTPERVTQDFVKTILKIPGGSGTQITSFLKKIGFVNSDGTPSDLYKRFRNKATSATAAADALRLGYSPLYRRNEFMHQMDDDALRGLIIEETGLGEDSNVPPLILSAITAIKKFAVDDKGHVSKPTVTEGTSGHAKVDIPSGSGQNQRLDMNLSYTINLNLPATSDIAVFNAIFKSLKDHIVRQ
jgi:hypothetical protein